MRQKRRGGGGERGRDGCGGEGRVLRRWIGRICREME